MEKNSCKLRQDFDEKEEKTIILSGDAKKWVDVEADAATFDKQDVSNSLEFQHLIKKEE